jgi:hypothetical protein
VAGTVAFVARLMSRWSYLKKMLWLSRRILKVSPYLGSLVIVSTKPPCRTRPTGCASDEH